MMSLSLYQHTENHTVKFKLQSPFLRKQTARRLRREEEQEEEEAKDSVVSQNIMSVVKYSYDMDVLVPYFRDYN